MNKKLEERDIDYLLISNRLKKYYNSVCNIDIIELFVKKNNLNAVNISEYIKKIMGKDTKCYILIKDNNKKIFKYKFIKIKFSCSDFKQHIDYFDLGEIIYYNIDKELAKYYSKKYLSKNTTDFTEDIIKKHNKISEDYKLWLIENYNFQQK